MGVYVTLDHVLYSNCLVIGSVVLRYQDLKRYRKRQRKAAEREPTMTRCDNGMSGHKSSLCYSTPNKLAAARWPQGTRVQPPCPAVFTLFYIPTLHFADTLLAWFLFSWSKKTRGTGGICRSAAARPPFLLYKKKHK